MVSGRDLINQIRSISNKFETSISSMRNLVLLFPPMYLHYQNYLKKEIIIELDIKNNYDIPDLIQMINWEKITKKKTINDKTYHLHEQLEILHLFFNTRIYLIYDMINTTLISNFFAYVTEV
jgi:hypothetical protein